MAKEAYYGKAVAWGFENWQLVWNENVQKHEEKEYFLHHIELSIHVSITYIIVT